MKLRNEFLNDLEFCQAHIKGICDFMPTEVHHRAGRTGALLTDVSKFLGVCMPCHRWIELHPKEAKEHGYSLSRLSKKETL